MLINKAVISNLSPCSSRFNNYLDHYEKFNGSLDDFLDLDKITYSDKIWVASRLLNKNQLVHFGLLCAESVLNIYEDKYPKDKRVKDCIEYLKTIKNYDNISSIERENINVHTANAYAANAYAATNARIEQESLNLEYLKIAASI